MAALAFACLGLLFTALLPSMDHMSLPFFLVILPIGFASNTYFALPDVAWLTAAAQANPLLQLAEGLRALLIEGTPTWRIGAALGLLLLMIAVLIPVDMRRLRRRIFGES